MVKLTFGDFGDSFSMASIRAYLAEFIATLLFVFAGVGSAIAFSKYNFISFMQYASIFITIYILYKYIKRRFVFFLIVFYFI